MNKRTFIAIQIKPEKWLLNVISDLKSALKQESFKWVDESMFHVTLHFIGETNDKQVNQVIEFLLSKTNKLPVFEMNLLGVDYFGPGNQPKVLVVKAKANSVLNHFVNETAIELAKIGLPGNLKSFSPHVTIARIKTVFNPSGFHGTVERFKESGFQNSLINEIIFYESILQPTGAVYIPIQIFKLKQ